MDKSEESPLQVPFVYTNKLASLDSKSSNSIDKLYQYANISAKSHIVGNIRCTYRRFWYIYVCSNSDCWEKLRKSFKTVKLPANPKIKEKTKENSFVEIRAWNPENATDLLKLVVNDKPSINYALITCEEHEFMDEPVVPISTMLKLPEKWKFIMETPQLKKHIDKMLEKKDPTFPAVSKRSVNSDNSDNSVNLAKRRKIN